MRLIDADALIERLKYSFYSSERVSIETVVGCFLDETGCAPTVDAKLVVHGHWIKHNEGNPMFLYGECSVCNFEQSVSYYLKYCPNCGAKMDGGVLCE